MSTQSLEPDGVPESEDLFGFQDSAGAASASEPVSDGPLSGSDRFGESDDLFNFDELTAEPELDEEAIAELLAEIPDEPPEPDAPAAPAADDAVPSPARVARTTRSAPAVAVAPTSLGSGTLWVLVAFTALNLAVIGMTWKISSDVQAEVGDATRYIIDSAREIQARTGAHVERMESVQGPIVAPDASRHTTFERARVELEAGEVQSARRRLYALLAVIDRIDEEVRDDVEARARFMLADVALAEALATPGNDVAVEMEGLFDSLALADPTEVSSRTAREEAPDESDPDSTTGAAETPSDEDGSPADDAPADGGEESGS